MVTTKIKSVIAFVTLSGASLTILFALPTAQPRRYAQAGPPATMPSTVSTSSDNGDMHTRADTVLPSARYGSHIDLNQPSVTLDQLDLRSVTLSAPNQIGVNRSVSVSPNTGAQKFVNLDGSEIVVLIIKSSGSSGIGVHFRNFALSVGEEVYVYGPAADSIVFGPFTNKGPWGSGEFWSGTLVGDTAVIEFYRKETDRYGRGFEIFEISHIFPQLDWRLRSALPDVLNCEPDASCYGDAEKNAVARILFNSNGTYVCTGTLLNDRAQDHIPYFLTANHCVQTQAIAQTVEAYWFYQTTSCNSGVLRSWVHTGPGANLLATQSSNDFSLLRLLNNAPGGAVFSAWTAAVQPTGTGVFGLHHPGGYTPPTIGSYLRRAGGAITSTSGACSDSGLVNGYIIDWTSGTTEPGSSGSAVWNLNGSLVGVLSCGSSPPTCSNSSGWYSKFASFYPQIQPYIDSGGTPTPTPTATPNPTAPPVQYTIHQIGGGIVPGSTDTGNHCDDCITTVALPFSYTLYGHTFNSLTLSSDGKTADALYSIVCLPLINETYTIFPYWADLRTDLGWSGCSAYPGGRCGIYTSVSGIAPNRIFNIEWRAVYYSNNAQPANFELRLHEGQLRFDVIYGTVAQGNSGATAGVQENYSSYTQYFCNGSGGAATGGQSYTGAGSSPTLNRFDFNSDGKTDYALQNGSTHQTAVWYLNNNVYLGGGYAPTSPAGWVLVDVADFNGDGKTDYALFNPSTRETSITYLNNRAYLGSAYGPTLPSGWQLVAVDDFNGDGKPDYVLYNSISRQTAIWYLNDNVRIDSAYAPAVPSGWQFVAAGDFNGDSKPDYVLYNSSTRQTAIWYLNNNVRISAAYGPTISSGYVLSGVADFNGDGKPDYVLYNPSTGQTLIWYLNNNVHTGSASGPTLPAGWSLGAP